MSELDLYPADRTPFNEMITNGNFEPMVIDEWWIDNSLERDIQTEMKKGRVTGHFV